MTISTPAWALPETKSHVLARTLLPSVPDDAFGRRFPALSKGEGDPYLGALLARESGAFGAFKIEAGRSVSEVLSGPAPRPMLPPRRAEDDQSHEEARHARTCGPKLLDASEFCERFIPRVTEQGTSRDRIALVTLHRLAAQRGLKACPSLITFCRAVQQLYETEGGERGKGTVLVGRRLKAGLDKARSVKPIGGKA